MLLTVEQALEMRKGKKLVFTNGVFDILHAGHVNYLEDAAKLGDLLIVGLNTDESVSLLKGPTRPIHTLRDRATVVSALRCVSGVVSFAETDPRKVIIALQPDIHVKGGDYTPEGMIETPHIKSYGGEVVILPLTLGHSTTSILSKL